MQEMTEMYQQLGISQKVLDFGNKIEEDLKERFLAIDENAEYNQLKFSSCHAEKQGQRGMSVFIYRLWIQ